VHGEIICLPHKVLVHGFSNLRNLSLPFKRLVYVQKTPLKLILYILETRKFCVF
jgi:hypothetical protein